MILCAGEALIDMLPRMSKDDESSFVPVAGGSVFNIFIALGRLGVPVRFFTGLSNDLFGQKLESSLAASGVEVLPVPPAVRAKYATGKGNAGKDEVLLAASRRYPHAPIVGNDDADAVVLAAIGARMLGEPIEDSLPKTHLDALARLSLPTPAP